MESTLSFRRDGVILACLHLVGLSYFALFLTSFLIFRYPAQADAINRSQGVIFYCGGAIVWSLCSLVYRLICMIYGNDARSRQKIEFAGTLFLIYTSAIPVVVLESAIPIYARLVCLLWLTVAMAQGMAEIITMDGPDSARAFRRFCFWLGLLALMPATYILLHRAAGSSSLAFGLVRLAALNVLGALLHLAGLPERCWLVGSWRPSLYLMHLVVIMNHVLYAQDVVHALSV
jgi:predicted membrane channel-forming protein YqfA (hemolysin III family)